MVKKGQTKKPTKGTKGASVKTAGSGYDPTPFYKRMPDGYTAVQTVGKATEIRGRPMVLEYDPSTKLGSVTIEDIKGKSHTARIVNALMFDTIMYFMGEYNNLPKFRTSDKSTRNNMINRALKYTPRVPLMFRLAEDDDGTYVFGVMSDKWRHVTAEDHIGLVKSTLKDIGLKADCKVKKSDGLHGGFIHVTPTVKDDLIQPEARFDFGKWDGYHKVRGIAGGQVLACANQLSIEVRGIMGKLEIGSFAALSDMHTGTDEKFESLVRKVAEAIGAYGTIANASQKVKVSEERMKMIVQYYTDKNVISGRTQALVLEALKDKEIQQVKGTLYGLAMALSYVGTHNDDIRDGVKTALQNLGGEILVVSQDANNFWKIIKKHHDDRPKKEAEKPAPKPAPKPAAKKLTPNKAPAKKPATKKAAKKATKK